MKKSSNKIFWITIIGFLVLAFIGWLPTQEDYARITDVSYKAVVMDEPGSEGSIHITERLTFDIHAASRDNLFWELWRDLPEDYIDGVKVDYEVLSVKQIMEDGTEIIYDKSPKLYWDDYDYVDSNPIYGPEKWYHSRGPYDEDEARYECVFFYVDGLYREEVVFEIEYIMNNAALKYDDCSDLYISLYSGESIEYLESFEAEILFPLEDMPDDGNYDVYTYGTNSNDFPVHRSFRLNPGYCTFYFELDEEDLQFKPYNQYIEFDLVSHGRDKHIFTEYAPDNYYTDDDVLDEIYEEQEAYATAPERFKTIKTIVLFVSIGLSAWLIFGAINKVKKLKEKYLFFVPEHDIELYRDIPSDLDPNFAATLVFCKHKPPKDNSGVYSALLLSLARKKYIELIERANGDVLILIKKQTPKEDQTLVPLEEPDFVADEPVGFEDPESTPIEVEPLEPLTTCEKYYFNLLIRHAKGDHIHMKEFQDRVAKDYDNTYSFTKNMENSIVNIGIQDGYFQKANYTQPKDQLNSSANTRIIWGLVIMVFTNSISILTRLDLAFGAFFIFGLSCIVSALYLKTQANKYILLTRFGETEYEKWRGLYDFLNSDTLMNERTFIELPLWEKYLVYATAFGISEKIIDAIKLRFPETTDSSSIVNNNFCRSGRIRTSGRSFHSSVRSGSGGGYSSSGGGFGYGGGGRGGGGGGGGH